MSVGNNITYSQFLQQKLVIDQPSGFEPGEITPLAFDFQQSVIRWALVRGRAAVFMDIVKKLAINEKRFPPSI